jgi:hypothetical protein
MGLVVAAEIRHQAQPYSDRFYALFNHDDFVAADEC